MKKRIIPVAVALLLLMSSCSLSEVFSYTTDDLWRDIKKTVGDMGVFFTTFSIGEPEPDFPAPEAPELVASSLEVELEQEPSAVTSEETEPPSAESEMTMEEIEAWLNELLGEFEGEFQQKTPETELPGIEW